MSQTAIPLEFEQYLQNKVSLKQPTDLNEIIFAMIPDLDLSQPIDRTVSLPPLEQWVFQQDVDQIGKSGSNAVVYSVVIPGSTEPFTFNAMFLRDKNVPNSCGMVVYKATETKETGMALTKSMLMQFDGAAAAANVTIDAATWQIDYQARLKGMDEDHRLSCLDNYGHTAFVDGFDVTRHEIDQTKYLIAPGVAYVGGLRIQNALSTVQTVDSKPTTLWVDVYRDGTALSQHENLFQIVATTDALVDYTDSENRPHYVAKLARIEADGSIVDLRVKGGLDLAELKSNAASDVEIDTESTASKHVKLPQLWRALTNRITLGFSIQLSQNGFIAFPDFLGGLIIQWGAGKAAADASDAGYANVLPMTYPTKQLVAMGIHTGGDASSTNVINNNRTTTHVYFESAYGSEISIMYLSVGY